MKRRRLKIGLRVVAGMLVIYTATYLWLSLRGRYEPEVFGSNGVKSYLWAPEGFVTDSVRNKQLSYLFLPLFIMDIRLWHTFERAHTSDYPINRISHEEMVRLLRKKNP